MIFGKKIVIVVVLFSDYNGDNFLFVVFVDNYSAIRHTVTFRGLFHAAKEPVCLIAEQL